MTARVASRQATMPLSSRAVIRSAQRHSELLALALGAAAWEIAARLLDFAFLPLFSAVLARAAALIRSPGFMSDLGASGINFLLGYALAVVLGVVVGVLIGRFRILAVAIEPYVNTLLVTPTLIFAPALFMIFGLGRPTFVVVVFLYVFPIVALNTMSGVERIDRSLLEMARVFGLRERQIITRIVIPSGLPLLMAGVRLGVSRGVKGTINGEMLIALVGLGGLVRAFGGAFDAEGVLAIVLLITLFSLCVGHIVRWIDRKIVWWTHGR